MPLRSELQALLLEAQLIKTYTPKYNIRLKDDRSPLYIVITAEPFPRVLTVRKRLLRNSKFPVKNYYGPFPSGFKAKEVLKTLRKIFPFCNSTPRQKAAHHPCFYSHIGLCSGACTGRVSRREYATLIRRLTAFLSGKEILVIKSLKRTMRQRSQNQDYEAAAQIRDRLEFIAQLKTKRLGAIEKDEITQNLLPQSQVHSLQTLLKLKQAPQRIEAFDISNIQGKHGTGSMVVFVGGEPETNQYRHFKIRNLTTPNDVAMMNEVIKRRARHQEWGIPHLIIVDGGKAQVNAAKQALKSISKSPWPKIPVIGIAKKEELVIVGNQRLRLARSSPGLKLIQKARDEAHRFARALYHKIHQKNLLKGQKT